MIGQRTSTSSTPVSSVRGRHFTHSARVHAGLQDSFSVARIGGHIAAGLIKNLSGPINQLLKGLGTAAKPLGQALTMAFSGLFKGLGSKGMNTMFKDLGSAFLLIGKLLKQVLPVLGPALINVLSMVLKGVTPLVPMFGKVFVTAISDLLKVLVKTWPAFQNVLNAVLPLLPNLMNLTMKAIIPMINPLDQLVLALLQLANQVLIPLIPSLSTFLQPHHAVLHRWSER